MNIATRTASVPPSGRTLSADVDLQTILVAWQEATDRLQRTHQTLRDEVRRLSDELEVKNHELARKNRLADLGQMAAHVAHEVRNSLVPLTLYLSLLRRKLHADQSSLSIVDKIESGFTALEAVVHDLLHFTSHREPHCHWMDVTRLVAEVCDSLAPQLSAQKIRVHYDIPEETRFWADADLLRRAFLNLVLNALDAMPEGGELVVTACTGHYGYELEVADSGPGIREDVRRRLFEPFVTTKRSGTGLGLAIVGRIAEVHGGSVRASNCAEGGAAFTITIPHRPVEVAA